MLLVQLRTIRIICASEIRHLKSIKKRKRKKKTYNILIIIYY